MPLFEADNEDFLLTLYNLNYFETDNVGEDVTQEDIDSKIRKMIKENNQISTDEIANVLEVSARTVKRHIKKMEDIIYVGSGYSGHWEVKE